MNIFFRPLMQVTLRALWSGMTFSRGWRTFLCFLSNVEIWRECLFIPLFENGLFGEKKVKRPSFSVILGKQMLWGIRASTCVRLKSVSCCYLNHFILPGCTWNEIHLTWLWCVCSVHNSSCTGLLTTLYCPWKEISAPWAQNWPGKCNSIL